MGLSVAVTGWDRVGARVSGVESGDGSVQEARWLRKLDGGGFLGTGVGGRAWIEASLPKRVGPDNIEGLTLDHAREVMAGLYAEAAEFLTIEDGETLDTARVKRLDLVRDIDAGRGMHYWLDGQATIRRGGRVKVRRFQDGELNRAETLRVGPATAWNVYAYDKEAETAGAAPPGRMRIEARMRSDLLVSAWAGKHGGLVRQVADLHEDKLRRYTRGMFTRVCFDQGVAAMGHVVQEALAVEELSERERAVFLAYLVAASFGQELRLSDKTIRKYRDVAGRLGLIIGAPVEADAYTMRVDFDEARMVTAA